jgi:hypothetical protein
VCREGIDYRVCSRGGVEKGLGVAVFLRGTFRVRVIVDRARGVFVDLGVTGRTRSTNNSRTQTSAVNFLHFGSHQRRMGLLGTRLSTVRT